MKLYEKLCCGALLILLFVWWGGMALANPIPMAEILYTEKELDNDWWQYDFSFINATEYKDDPTLYLFQVDLYFNTDVEFNLLGTANGWHVKYPVSGNLNAISLNLIVTTPEDINDPGIAPESSLSGFSFEFNRQVGNLPFVAFFADPNWDLMETPAKSMEGTTAPIPEPATILLVASGALGLGLFKRKKFKNRL
jgi:hypothetical protein